MDLQEEFERKSHNLQAIHEGDFSQRNFVLLGGQKCHHQRVIALDLNGTLMPSIYNAPLPSMLLNTAS